MITQDELKKLFHYDPEGFLVYAIRPRGRSNKGDKAGTPQPNGYWHVMIKRKRYLVHRLIYLYHHGVLPKEIDHIDGNKANNRIENLREATRRQNSWNTPVRKVKSKSGYRGVIYLPDRDRWLAYTQFNGKMKYIGHFNNKHDAARAYNDFVLKHRGEFAVLNEVHKTLPSEFSNPKPFTGLDKLEYVS